MKNTDLYRLMYEIDSFKTTPEDVIWNTEYQVGKSRAGKIKIYYKRSNKGKQIREALKNHAEAASGSNGQPCNLLTLLFTLHLSFTPKTSFYKQLLFFISVIWTKNLQARWHCNVILLSGTNEEPSILVRKLWSEWRKCFRRISRF